MTETQVPIGTPDRAMIAVLLPTRGRPGGAERAAKSLLDRAAAPERVHVIVGLDLDDDTPRDLVVPATLNVADREDTLGGKLNRLAAIGLAGRLGDGGADILVYFADDLVVTTDGWDDVLREWIALWPDRLGLWSLSVAEQPGHLFAHLPVLTRETVDLLGYFAPDVFPFWWWDSWLDEIATIAGRKLIVPVQVASQTAGPDWRGKVTGLRDVAFWARHFEATRDARVRDAGKILSAIGSPGLTNMARQQLPLTRGIMAARNANLCDPAEAATFERDWAAGDGLDEARYQRVKERAMGGAVAAPAVVTTPAMPDHALDASIAVWGKWHTDMLIKVGLPSLMLPGNFDHVARLHIHTRPGWDVQRLEAAVAAAGPAVRQRIAVIASVPAGAGAHLGQSTALSQAIWRADIAASRARGRAVVLTPPDVAWSPGCFQLYAETLRAGAAAVFHQHPRVVADFAVGQLQRPEDFDNPNLARLALEIEHPIAACQRHDSPNYPDHADAVSWRGDDWLLWHTLFSEPRAFDPARVGLNAVMQLDRVVPFYAVSHCDHAIALSLTPADRDEAGDAHWPTTGAPFSLERARASQRMYHSPISPLLAGRSYLVRTGAGHDAPLDAAIDFVEAVFHVEPSARADAAD